MLIYSIQNIYVTYTKSFDNIYRLFLINSLYKMYVIGYNLQYVKERTFAFSFMEGPVCLQPGLLYRRWRDEFGLSENYNPA